MAGNLIKKDGILEKGNLRIPFQIIRSSRKTLAVQVKADGQVVIRVPLRTSWKEAERFLEQMCIRDRAYPPYRFDSGLRQ